MRRVVITGAGAVSPFGMGVEALLEGLWGGHSGIRKVAELEKCQPLRPRIAGLVPSFDEKQIPRQQRRSMSRMSLFAAFAAKEAVASAGLDPRTCGDAFGCSIGATVGSPQSSESFFRNYLPDQDLSRLKSPLFFQIMNHSCAANVAQYLGIQGRLLAPASACSTGCQAVGYAAEMIAAGLQDWMLCGGAEEFHPVTAAIFDIMNAASYRYNGQPEKTPRPFDRDRDGVVCSEGSGLLVLESLDSALQRGATILAEITGFATITDPDNIAQPNGEAMKRCMRAVLDNGGCTVADIDYINAHATATEQGDVSEAAAIADLFGDRVPVSSFKGYLGHTMAASGALELIGLLSMFEKQALIPTLNLEKVDPACAGIDLPTEQKNIRLQTALKNNFALGGVNSSLILRRYDG